MSMDLAVFLDKDFDPKSYINATCTRKPADQPIDRYLAELEMKLHLGSEDISLYLQDQATRATQRIPLAARELARIREDAQSVRSSVSTTLSKLQEDTSHGSINSTLATLEEIDGIKLRMEAACSTLKEAAGLSTLFHLVDDLFASGDLPRAAEALAGIRRGLAVVADTLPEFRTGRERLAALEDRFTAAAEAPLHAALTNQRGDEAASLAAVLININRREQVSKAFITARSAPLWALWESYTVGTPFISWLSTFYDQVLHSIASECEWCKASLPDLYPNLVTDMIETFFLSLDKPHRARLAGALTGTQGSLLPLEHLEQATAAAADFINGLRRELISAGAWETDHGLMVLNVVIAPVENAILQYHEKELQYLTAELPRLLAPAREASISAGALPLVLDETIEPAFAAINASVARCVRLTGSTGLPALTRVLDRVVQQYISAVQSAIQLKNNQKSSTTSVPGGAVAKQPGEGAETPKPEVVLPLLVVVAKIQSSLQESTTALVQTVNTTIPAVLDEPTPVQVPLDLPLALTALRLETQPSLKQQLSIFAATAAAIGSNNNSSHHASLLPFADASLDELAGIIEFLAEKSLLHRVTGHFNAIPTMKEWQGQPTAAAGVQLPSFTPYPLQYVTAVGEYLMMLPQILESALASEGIGSSGNNNNREKTDGGEVGTPIEDDEATFAAQLVADWVDRAALAASQLYLGQLHKIRGPLSAQGTGQLVADIEYFSNVLSTLGLASPPELAAWQAALVAPDAAALEALKSMATAEGSGNTKSAVAVETVMRLRGISSSCVSGGRVSPR